MITTTIPAKMSINQAQTLISDLQNKIQQQKDQESQELEKTFQKEINSEYLQILSKTVKKMYQKLNRRNFPQGIVCSHIGVGEKVGNDYVQMSIKDEQLLITIYRSDKTSYPNGKSVGYSLKDHQKKVKAVKMALNAQVVDRWNGQDNHNGISLVLDKKVPPALKIATDTYHNLKDVFNPTRTESQWYKNFDQWYNS